LRQALAALPLGVEDVHCESAEVAVPGYPGGRPTSVVTLRAGDDRGAGELVAFAANEHAAFRDAIVPRVPRGRGRVDAFVAAVHALTANAYARAALEAAAVDLALRQARTNRARLVDVQPRSVRYVVSFGPLRDPLPAVAGAGEIEVKLDVDARWDGPTLAALAATGRVAVLDWKGGGERSDHERLHTALPDALVEDPAPAAGPWSPTLQARLVADVAVTTAAAVDDAAAVNLKPARMGGVFEALCAAARCERDGRDFYFGGMWEVGPGRQQLRVLASLLAPDGPNDIAPLVHGGVRPPRLHVDPAGIGFTGGSST
jgi:hypothetical protein